MTNRDEFGGVLVTPAVNATDEFGGVLVHDDFGGIAVGDPISTAGAKPAFTPQPGVTDPRPTSGHLSSPPGGPAFVPESGTPPPPTLGQFEGLVASGRQAFKGTMQGYDAGVRLPAAARDAKEAERLREYHATSPRVAAAPVQPQNRVAPPSGPSGEEWPPRAREIQPPARGLGTVADAVRRDPNVAAALERIGTREKELKQIGSSEAMQRWDGARGWDAAKVFMRDPFEITANIVVKGLFGSVPAVVMGAVGGSAAGPGGTAAGAGYGSLGVEYSSKILELLREEGVDPQNPEQLLRAVMDEQAMQRRKEKAVLRGLPVAALDAFSGAIAGKFLAGAKGTKEVIKAGAKEAGAQGASGAIGELAGQQAAGEPLNLKAAFEEAVGELGPGAVETAVNVGRERLGKAPSGAATGDTPVRQDLSKPTDSKILIQEIRAPSNEEILEQVRGDLPAEAARQLEAKMDAARATGREPVNLQFKANAGADQAEGNQMTIRPLNQADYTAHVRKEGDPEQVTDYWRRHAGHTHVRLVRRGVPAGQATRGEWQFAGVGQFAALLPSREAGDWKFVTSFESEDARAIARTPDQSAAAPTTAPPVAPPQGGQGQSLSPNTAPSPDTVSPYGNAPADTKASSSVANATVKPDKEGAARIQFKADAAAGQEFGSQMIVRPLTSGDFGQYIAPRLIGQADAPRTWKEWQRQNKEATHLSLVKANPNSSWQLSGTGTLESLTPPGAAGNWRQVDRFGSEEARAFGLEKDTSGVKPPKLRKSKWALPARADGQLDVLDAINELGGIRPPVEGRTSKYAGEYDGYAEAFRRGLARMLRRTTGLPPDELIENLPTYGFNFETADEMYAAVDRAAAVREKMREPSREELETQFLSAALDNQGKSATQKGARRLPVDLLQENDEFRVKGEPVKFVRRDAESGAVTVDAGKYGRIDLPRGIEVYPDQGSYQWTDAPVAGVAPWEDPTKTRDQKIAAALHAIGNREMREWTDEEVARLAKLGYRPAWREQDRRSSPDGPQGRREYSLAPEEPRPPSLNLAEVEERLQELLRDINQIQAEFALPNDRRHVDKLRAQADRLAQILAEANAVGQQERAAAAADQAQEQTRYHSAQYSLDSGEPGRDDATNARYTESELDEAGQRLAAGLVEDFPILRERTGSIVRVHPDLGDPVSRQAVGISAPILQAFEAAFGVRLVFLRHTDGRALPINGVRDPRYPGVLFIDARSPRPALLIAGHELIHEIAADRVLYRRLMGGLFRLMTDLPGWQQKLNDLLRERNAGLQYSPIEALNELAGDFLGEQMAEPKFWARLQEREPSLFRALAKAVADFLNEVGSRIQRLLTRAPGLETHAWIRDIDAARELVADVVADFARGRQGGRPGTSGERDFSLDARSVGEAERMAAASEQNLENTRYHSRRDYSLNSAEDRDALRARLAGLQSELSRLNDQLEVYVARKEQAPRELLARRADLRSQVEDLQAEIDGQADAPATTDERAAASQAIARDVIRQVETASAKGKGWRDVLNEVKAFFGRFSSSLPELPVTGDKARFFMPVREWYRYTKSATKEVRRRAEEDLAHVLKPLMETKSLRPEKLRLYQKLQARLDFLQRKDPNSASIGPLRERLEALDQELMGEPYYLFQTAVVWRDLWYRTFLTRPNGEPVALPNNLTPELVRGRLAEIHAAIREHPERAAIEESLRRHYKWMHQLQAELLDHGQIIAEEQRNPLYFPHHVIEHFTGNLDRVRPRTDDEFRSYLVAPVGTAKLHLTNYLQALYVHAADVRSHNAQQDLNEKYLRPFDVSEQAKRSAQALAEREGRLPGFYDWKQPRFHPPGYRLYDAAKKLALRLDYIVDRETLAKAIGVAVGDGDLRERMRELGVDLNVTADQLHAALVASDKNQWLLPNELVDALEAIADREQRESLDAKEATILLRSWRFYLKAWKWNTLFNYLHTLRYSFNNFVSDGEKVLVWDPGMIRYFPQAAKEVLAMMRGRGLSKDIHEAMKRGVLDSVTMGEVGEIHRFERFAALLTAKEKSINRFLKFLRFPGTANAYREGVFRYAKFLADVNRIRSGEAPVYGGAYWRDVEAIDGAYSKAAYISRRTFVDYEDISASGQWARRNLIPFYSWIEGNLRSHVNLFRNFRDVVFLGQQVRGARRVAAIALMTRMAFLWGAVQLWNHGIGALAGAWGDDDDLEAELSAEDRRRFHIVVGRNSKGEPGVIYTPTAFSDALDWLGGNNLGRLIGEYARGEITFDQVVSDWAKQWPRDVANKVVGGVNPAISAGYTALSGRDTFPDVTNQRRVVGKEKWWLVLSKMTDRDAVMWLRSVVDDDFYTPDLSNWWQQKILQIRRRDPEQWAYYEIREMAADWKEEKRGKRNDGSDYTSNDLQVLRNFRRAVYRGDVEEAARFYDRLLEFGYTAEQFRQSIDNQDPLSDLGKKNGDRAAFVESLSKAERELLTRAMRYYAKIQAAKGEERDLFPREGRGGFTPRPDILEQIITGRERLTDPEADELAQRLIEASLKPARR
ncbi:MAG: hypothetical protein AB1705_08480 [Verrucomicrobiota bacterium]